MPLHALLPRKPPPHKGLPGKKLLHKLVQRLLPARLGSNIRAALGVDVG